jgi:hypothetical protein
MMRTLQRQIDTEPLSPVSTSNPQYLLVMIVFLVRTKSHLL